MSTQSSPIRILVGPCRSGTTVLLRSLAQHPGIAGFYQYLKTTFRQTGIPDYGIFHPTCKLRTKDCYRGKLLLFKETIGHRNLEECQLKIFPYDQAVRESLPVFLFRDPRATYQSWKRNELGDLELFVSAFESVYHDYKRILRASNTTGCLAITFEELTNSPERVLSKICQLWEIELHPDMLRFKKSLAESIENKVDPELADDREAYEKLHQRTEDISHFKPTKDDFSNLDELELLTIEQVLLPRYQEISQARKTSD